MLGKEAIFGLYHVLDADSRAAEGGNMIPTRQQLEDGRHCGFRTYGYFWSFCELNRSCEECDKTIRIGCVMKRKIEELQTKRILSICKSEPPKEE